MALATVTDSSEPASHPASHGVSGVVQPVRRAVLRTLLLPGIRRLYRPFLRNAATVFLLHRFSDPDRGVVGHDPEHLRRCLVWLQDNDVPVISLDRLVRRSLAGSEVPSGAVCFTVDDAYDDFYRVGLPVFAEQDCPVTVFVPTGFVDGDCWLWWDQIEYVVRRTDRRRLPSPVGDGYSLTDGDDGDRRRVARSLRADLQRLPDARKERALQELSERGEVPLPSEPPAEYRPLTWGQIREAEGERVHFAPHSVTHPVLSMTSADRLEREVVGSWTRLQEQIERPVPVFGYPLGAAWAFGQREEQAVRDAGLLAAMSTRRRYVRTRLSNVPRDYRWRLPRLGFPPDWTEFTQIASGLLRLRHLVMHRAGSLATDHGES